MPGQGRGDGGPLPQPEDDLGLLRRLHGRGPGEHGIHQVHKVPGIPGVLLPVPKAAALPEVRTVILLSLNLSCVEIVLYTEHF